MSLHVDICVSVCDCSFKADVKEPSKNLPAHVILSQKLDFVSCQTACICVVNLEHGNIKSKMSKV